MQEFDWHGLMTLCDPPRRPRLSQRFREALNYAFELHAAQQRKGPEPGIAYLGHLLGVCSIVIDDDGTEDEAIAALLHDAVEDAGGRPTLEQIRIRFGERVADIVEACSDTDVVPKPPWRERKLAYLAHLEDSATPRSALRVSAADKLNNARALLDDYRRFGEELWERFTTASAEDQLWYYTSLVEIFLRRYPALSLIWDTHPKACTV